jgi:hypothetical protein
VKIRRPSCLLTCFLYWSHLLDASSATPWSQLPFAAWWLLNGAVEAGTDTVEVFACLSSVCGLGGGLLLLRTTCWSVLSSSVEGSVMVRTGVRRRLVGESFAWRWPSRDEVEVLLCCLLVVELLDPVPSPLTSMRGFVGEVLFWNWGHTEGK